MAPENWADHNAFEKAVGNTVNKCTSTSDRNKAFGPAWGNGENAWGNWKISHWDSPLSFCRSQPWCWTFCRSQSWCWTFCRSHSWCWKRETKSGSLPRISVTFFPINTAGVVTLIWIGNKLGTQQKQTAGGT